ncbi:MAG: CDP-alcohol phosphatidyltransferase family protein, partial [Candidatus Competibacteraceae bacterium]|nr:CDP-alcohol phosphatidyltransferase family protein [Candidatus Competibacteraceae bacterium]
MNCSSLQPDSTSLTLSAARAVAMGGLAVTLLAVAGHRSLDLPLRFIPQTLLGFLGVALVLAVLLPQHRPWPRLGAANGVTLARGAVAALLMGLLGHAEPSLGWPAGLMALGALILDGVDGHLARASGMVSRCGARFDMEVDALFVAVLALLVW